MNYSQKIPRCSNRSNLHTLDVWMTDEMKTLQMTNDDFVKALDEFTNNCADLAYLIAVSHTLLIDQKQVMHVEMDKKKIIAVQDNYVSLLNIAKQMQNDGLTYVRAVNNTSEARKNIATLPKNYGVNQINSFIELMKGFASGQPEGIVVKYDAMIALGKKTLDVARETHREIVQKYDTQIKQHSAEKIALMNKVKREYGLSH